MTRLRIIVFVGAVCAVAPAAAVAQGRVPAAESAAVGGDAGVFVARDRRLDTGPALEGFFEYYVSARSSLRLGAGWAQPDFESERDDALRYFRVSADIVQNWEGGGVHPFVGVGLGMYFLQEGDNGRRSGDSETKLGGTLFGGAEFFTGRTTAVKGEARYHVVADVRRFNPDGLAVTIGFKKYF